MGELPKPYQKLSQSYPDLFQAYEQLGAAAAEAGPLDVKSRELIKMGMAAAMGSEGAVKSHCHRALEAGVTGAELLHTVLLGVTTMGFPTMMATLTWVDDVLADR
jgi:alkylhydroperoxidase/carboxymuconolactone decarboxylase family protein YurZ